MQPLKLRHRHSGFTLMEVLIAVAITAVIGLGVWQVLSSVVTARDRVNTLAESFDGLQRTMLLLERDLTQVVNRPVRNIYGDFEPSFTSRENGYALLLTRQGWRNPLGLRRSALQRVGWEYTGSELRRHYWPVVDQGQDTEAEELLLLDEVTAFEIRFLDRDRAWRDQWPGDAELAGLTPGTRPDLALPLGVEITLEHERFGELVRTFALPDFEPGTAQGLIDQQNQGQGGSDTEQEDGGQTPPGGSEQTGGGSG